jgi:hypothetical protein
MKKLILLIILVCGFSQIILCQTGTPFSKSSLLIGGNISYNYSDVTNHFPAGLMTQEMNITIQTWNIEFAPYCGYFFTKNICIGMQLYYGTTDTKQWTKTINIDTLTCTKVYSLKPGIFIRYYTKPKIFFEISGAWGIDRNYAVEPVTNSSDRTIDGGVGYSLFISNSIAIEPLIKYRMTKISNSSTGEEHELKGVYFNIGLQYYLKLKKAAMSVPE